MKMKLTREEALSLHCQMWKDMQRDLGDTPHFYSRADYKRNWIKEHFPDMVKDVRKYECDIIRHNCFLCEYADEPYGECECLIQWPEGRCEEPFADVEDNWTDMPISRLLALPVKGEE